MRKRAVAVLARAPGVLAPPIAEQLAFLHGLDGSSLGGLNRSDLVALRDQVDVLAASAEEFSNAVRAAQREVELALEAQ